MIHIRAFRAYIMYRSVMLAAGALMSAMLAPPVAAQDADFFERHIRPLLTNHCISCHGPMTQKSNLRLDSRAALLRGGAGGQVVKAGAPEQSRLIHAVRHAGKLRMPEVKLAERDISVLEEWVSLGLPWPDNVTLMPVDKLAEAASKHWAFQPIKRPTVPNAGHPIDAFVGARLKAARLKASPAADPRTLIRRASFDLIGLPPTPEEVAAFAKEYGETPQATYEALLDRLLASPRYGERWARHWLDVARYADNKGYVFFEDKQYPWAWTYRDYVIGAFNRDLPFDQFVKEQLAADRLKLDDPKSLAALGFLTLGGHFMNNTHDIIDDRIDVVTRGLLGLTVMCARCHDHKFDPIPQADYYSLYGVFRSCSEPLVPPRWGPAPDTEADRKLAKELADSEKKLVDFVTAKHRDLVEQARARAGEYLLAAHAARHQPPADDFMLIADKGDLNPAMITRWRSFLEETRQRRDPAWKPWHLFADFPEKEFAERSAAVVATLQQDKTVNPLVRERFAVKPSSMKEVSTRLWPVAGGDRQALARGVGQGSA